ncbi:hypothetical protein AZZ73_002573 [Klebsiella pneumoniae]|nr:hypothetical protein AZZ73_002573 [Klebsiella pneumoniae]
MESFSAAVLSYGITHDVVRLSLIHIYTTLMKIVVFFGRKIIIPHYYSYLISSFFYFFKYTFTFFHMGFGIIIRYLFCW